MAGGERERKGKKKETRFCDRKKPKPSKAELNKLDAKKDGFEMVSSKGNAFKFCPVDGQKLSGRQASCSKCGQVYGEKLIFSRGGSVFACLVDARDFLRHWRRRIFWRMEAPFHAGVQWVTGPPVPLAAFETILDKSWLEDSYATSAVKTVIRRLETTRGVEDSANFESVKDDIGMGAGKLLSSGSVLYLVPPIDIVHTDSKVAGSRVNFTYGWVILTDNGNIVKAEGQEVPPEGWEHVEARVRDCAASMLECGMEVSPHMVERSEASLLEQFDGDHRKFEDARVARGWDEAHFIWPRGTIQSRALVRKPEPFEVDGPSAFAAEERSTEQEALLFPVYKGVFAKVDAESARTEVEEDVSTPLAVSAAPPVSLAAVPPRPSVSIPSAAEVGGVALGSGRRLSEAELASVLGEPSRRLNVLLGHVREVDGEQAHHFGNKKRKKP